LLLEIPSCRAVMSASVNISSLIEIAVFMLDSITKGITVCQWDFYFSPRFVDRAVVSAGPRDKLFLRSISEVR
jgi:hypothetical protein